MTDKPKAMTKAEIEASIQRMKRENKTFIKRELLRMNCRHEAFDTEYVSECSYNLTCRKCGARFDLYIGGYV